MRLFWVVLGAGVSAASSAAASSFITLPAAPRDGGSIIHLGAPAPSVIALAPREPQPVAETPVMPVEKAAGPTIISPSIFALGEPAVEDMHVAAVEEKPARRGPNFAPMVIRGGLRGDAFERGFVPQTQPVAERAPPRQQPQRRPEPAPDPMPAAPPPPAPAAPPTRLPE